MIACFVIQCRIKLKKARRLAVEAADRLDRLGNKEACGTIAMAKVNIFCLFEVQGWITNVWFCVICDAGCSLEHGAQSA